ncbi:MAG TPA: bifunctional diguanylate cyclase/phosphodiesterase [Steroidobacteraceae bacterium]|nr:bifunctional diguanylate cyclase/phosphodiesterase [Steroidobacteraceae bacterium]
MSIKRIKRGPRWLPALLVFVTVAVAGSRLVFLSVQQRASEAREAAEGVAAQCARALDSQLAVLAARAIRAASGTELRAARDVFQMAADGHVTAYGGAAPATARAVASEWQEDAARPRVRTASLLGPMREGSEWLIAARAPSEAHQAGAGASGTPAPAERWAVAYVDLDRVFAQAHLSRLLGARYDFALAQQDASNQPARIFLGSQTEALSGPAVGVIHAPTGFTFESGGTLEFQVRPRAGWYPTRTLAADVGLLALLAWLLTFTAHDLTQRTQRLRGALDASRHRLTIAQQRLLHEIEQRQALEQSVDHARYHDAFTGLPNRRYFMDQLDRMLRQARARHGRLGVFLIDIDRFALINETLGHTAGDELMVQAGQRFQKSVSLPQSILARWGGDQFALLVPEIPSSEAAAALAGALQEALREPFELRRHRLSVTARVGMSSIDAGPHRAEDAMREADVALAVAKRQEELACVAYTPAMGGDVASLVSLEADLHVALERRELKLLYQPIVDLQGGQAVGAEALLRWRHPVEGVLRPDRFLPIAEEVGLIVPITRWTVRRVCRLASEWRRRLPPGTSFFLSVNLSAVALRDPELSDYVADLLRETALPPEALKFELTEGGLMGNVAGAREMLERLRRTGVQLMLDDFGTGYSSLNYLQLFPFDYVKIDRPQVSEGISRRGPASLASAMVQLASSLGLTPIAEVVESQATATALAEMGCHFGQGNFFCAPVEAEDALTRLSAGAAGASPVLAPQSQGATWEDDSPTLVLPAGMITEDDAQAFGSG